ncbi:tRNA preQ1(34) S-adenosylmethionine ribosyltransferase-isomerase QueA [bacterium (Candidatus Blackallbacteria) CG17_big_fil_post_rev_8_21_14_2_50_48_46]|uniref:S-adenosylmethionine:tRNA ribosyltransferase-isomerase n=1 Tax=bacterium (Candidatus Blackallbacteria) CG17_big_fil_post_rev_8_21_14_2_50_48_46 TaxID=2014261 RepID=A0A2M7GBL9_9BACT|nr:MAG: tRNA preQ1(34) S-adenosylmethionine ribosyltransferase-isomerase QueA [bacterium (Candidatus Blackallbacteria) CG18_big_fil_WC_8_21_14_2_50_49_26]PIW19581.1 MAG: tRNA preQ1(34) S-adenosylmethionine ribosyltransferase-isomerase QueA [bacterium (Candidatus Blackallbacteria) CG17_big_fil_post_rev_8_21_14_2_50_48_46]PIW49097.1 MAG: tRNA preQ1(34) S-adenosylmethionine ribosyltransferase-isomerase QueA [bacterium (Candidatus Blackallbacteria) CG13_big_fil_rev_8_21_14_2_50_49_14]
MLLSSYDYPLPEELIAQTPADQRDASRLLVYERRTGQYQHRMFSDLPELLQPGDLLVVNNTRVFPARIFGTKAHTGTRFEFLLTRQIEALEWQAIGKHSRRIKPGYSFEFAEGIQAEILASHPGGQLDLRFSGLKPSEFMAWLERHGEIPYPPYITARESEKERYQTVFSQTHGSVAAPTAGLHFTPELFESLAQKGIEKLELTLHIGIGTFSPVRTQNIQEHTMHQEWYTLPAETAERLNQQRQSGKRIIAVGTTSLRTLETVWRKFGSFQADSDETRIFIYPGQSIEAIDGLITNFHLPHSSLLMLVAAWIGRERMMKLYAEAIQEKYRFFSFGDASLLL